jgi:uncharacterized protein YjbJ (UPF0337 family)
MRACTAALRNMHRFAALSERSAKHLRKEDVMNKDRIEGSAEQAKGKIKEVAGKVTGDSKLQTEGKADQVAGKIQNTVGGMKDAVKEAVDD